MKNPKLKRGKRRSAAWRSRSRLQRVVRERECDAFKAGWKAGQDYVNDHIHGYAYLSVPCQSAWETYRRKSALSNVRTERPEAN